MGEKTINTKLPFVRELCLKCQNIDPVRDLIPDLMQFGLAHVFVRAGGLNSNTVDFDVPAQ